MRHIRSILSAGVLSLPLVVLSCADDPAAPSNGEELPPTATVEAALVEITIRGIGTAHMAASAAPYGPRAQGDAGLPVGGAGGPSFTLTPIGGGDGSIQIDALSTGSFTVGERGAGGTRYVSATFRVRNAQSDGTAYTTPRQNLTFLAVDTDGTINETPVTSMRLFDGSDAADAIALEMVPTGRALLDESGQLVPAQPDVFQAFAEAEVETLDDGSATLNTVFPYGFVVRNPATPGDRTLPANPAANQFDGLVTFAFSIPLQASSDLDPFEVTIVVLATDDDEVRVTESLEEQTPEGAAALNALADAMSAPAVTLLGGSTTVIGPQHAVRRICRLRIAGVDPLNPLRTLVDAGPGCVDGAEDLPANVITVHDAATGGSGDGSSWTDAFTNLQDALACIRDADAACAGVDEIWVAASDSAYYPDDGAGVTEGDRDATFELIDGVAIYGGFASGEYARDQRDPDANPTVLSGDIDHDDPNPDGDYVDDDASDFGSIDNARHLLTGAGTVAPITSATVLDGLVITAAYSDDRGGGLVCTAGTVAGQDCNPTLRNLLFAGNYAVVGGGAIYYDFGNFPDAVALRLEDVVFQGNAGLTFGGGALQVNIGPALNLSLVRTDFIENSSISERAGALLIVGSGTCDVHVANSTFLRNESASVGGAISVPPAGCDVEAWNTLLAGNTATISSAAIEMGDGTLFLDNVTVADNQGGSAGPIIGGTQVFTNVIIRDNTPEDLDNPLAGSSAAHSILPGTTCPANFTCTDGVLFQVDPEFRDPLNGDYRLQASSQAVNTGDATLLPDDLLDLDDDADTLEPLSLDLDDNARVLDGEVDMGAYERQ